MGCYGWIARGAAPRGDFFRMWQRDHGPEEVFLNKAKGALVVAAVVIGFFLVTGILGSLTATSGGVFALVAVMAVLLVLAALFGNRR